MEEDRCPFCRLEPSRILLEDGAAVASADAVPVTDGHTLVLPRRRVVSLFELPEEE
jgi:diadenosine tetraphosphate (Ap4A) HIT family hydrolase